MKNILDLTHIDAKKFLLKGDIYCSIVLPKYFTFNKLLNDIDQVLNKNKLSDFYKEDTSKKKKKREIPKHYTSVNHKILASKDGKYAWRPLQIIHPAIYVDLVNHITNKENWIKIQSFFYANRKKSLGIECVSMPVISNTKEKHQAKQITNWWQELEQKSIINALEFETVFHTDITDCYGSIYTHSLEWALDGGKKNAKRGDVGTGIDRRIQDMSYGQTNGIPQGSVLMDFIAEIVLCYADVLLHKELSLSDINSDAYNILRYRDDYRIFVHSSNVGERIMKILTETLVELGMHLNTSKTFSSDDLISTSIKEDKLYWISHKNTAKTLQKNLLIIYDMSKRYPNTGTLSVLLTDFYENNLSNVCSITEDINVLISIVVNIVLRNPVVYIHSFAILGKLISFEKDEERRDNIRKQIASRFNVLPNTGITELWLQRISLSEKQIGTSSKEKMVNIVSGADITIWNTDWAEDEIKKVIDLYDIVDRKLLAEATDIIPLPEVKLFKNRPY